MYLWKFLCEISFLLRLCLSYGRLLRSCDTTASRGAMRGFICEKRWGHENRKNEKSFLHHRKKSRRDTSHKKNDNPSSLITGRHIHGYYEDLRFVDWQIYDIFTSFLCLKLAQWFHSSLFIFISMLEHAHSRRIWNELTMNDHHQI